MKLVKVERREIKRRFKRTSLLKLLDEFVAGGYECARVDDTTYVSASSGQSAINKAIKRFGFVGIKAVSQNNQIYIIKDDAEAENVF
jgi:hypothetical protein